MKWFGTTNHGLSLGPRYSEAAKSGPLRCLNDPHLAEALAVKEALSWSREKGLTRIQVFTDCQVVCGFINGAFQDLSYAGCVIRDCRDLRRHFEVVSFSYISRSVNKLAHALARDARSHTGVSSWSISIPSCIAHLI
ncbi:PREDICTED: uncharacterized protein LOC109165240 [Ipomoea nil]|uniref:uncharacterized protein LOC109165240 n=1 Tax=Ipomoea nil TaxID=35883 RepID=UPI000901A799|nr:PREDICTED: uncharacterized protein LOC109165240 [Ipomoea nil]